MKRADSVALVALLATVLLTVLFYGRLPEEVATHFDLSGTPNGSMTRGTFALFCPVLAVGLWMFHRLVVSRRRSELHQGATGAVGERMLLLQVFLVLGVHVFLLRNALVPTRGLVVSSVPLILGAIALVLALWLPRVRQNPYIGVRVPWTLRSQAVWAKTHRFAGYTYFAAFLGCVASLFLPRALAYTTSLSAFLVASFVPVGYSFWLSRTEGNGPHA